MVMMADQTMSQKKMALVRMLNIGKTKSKLHKATLAQTLSEPVTQKETCREENSHLCVGSSCMQGWRVNMEDSHTTILSLPDDPSTAFFAVCDGHGGARIAQYAGKNLHKAVLERPEYKKGDTETAIKLGYLDLDYSLMQDEVLKDERGGTTVVCVLLRENIVYCGNVGDSRAIASVAGKVVELSRDHKPYLDSEQRRITAAGGWVELGRVNGDLAMSRALGDFIYKKNLQKGPEDQIVTAWPEVVVRDINEDWEFIILACDGIWDVVSSKEMVDLVRLRLSKAVEPEDICADLITRLLATGRACDNMTMVLVCITNKQPWKELQEKCGRPAPPLDLFDDEGTDGYLF